MSEPVDQRALRECHSFSRYLFGRVPSAVVTNAYTNGLVSASFRAGPATTPLDEVLLTLARAGTGLAGIADAWGRLFAPAGQLRRRLVLLLAITESQAPDCEAVEPYATSRFTAIMSIMLAGVAFVGRLLLAVPIVIPLHMRAAMRARRHGGADSPPGGAS